MFNVESVLREIEIKNINFTNVNSVTQNECIENYAQLVKEKGPEVDNLFIFY